ncbi:polyprenyl synthetase family protein [Reinekea marina]|uniref:Polyprenyl synthetase family protein n=1 Tax=Reinekea marina TaxID=1310421 RepID=A0ABV7WPE0_9GAMM|nr:polyprenyl synthetase family protein [Reinekea marina]MDN3648688.1 polyprenyl synthetase family protein [Reinekea marina]
MDHKEIHAVIAGDFSAVNDTIHQQLVSNVPMVEKIADHIISSGGKRLRPTIVLLAAGLTNSQGTQQHQLATVIEFLHTATLLHDDVVDTSDMRRGKPTANAQWGNAASVLVGDFLYARAFELLVKIGQLGVMDTLAATTRKIAEGEVLQLTNVRNPDASEAQYLEVIKGKTAILFQACGECAGLIADSPKDQTTALANYGLHLGLAFQLIDDVLDYSGEAEKLGKNVGDDLAEGKPTLPTIHAMANCSEDERQLIRSCIRKGSLDQLNEVMSIMNRCGSLEYTIAKAEHHAEQAKLALDAFPESDYKQAMKALAALSVKRDF